MIILKRIKDFHDSSRVFAIYIDKKKVGTIKNGKQIELNVNPGEHLIHLTVDWCSSNVLPILLSENEDIVLLCYPTLKGSKKLFSLKNYTSNKDNYITIEVE